ncbi:MAG: hypothetical protein JWO38_7848 [Gemmataceae bacterium]|nr:hypothetical protein [Gemmataceae bacterium]
MTYRFFHAPLFQSVLLVCVFLPGRGAAQVTAGTPVPAGGGAVCPGVEASGPSSFGPGYYGPGPRYGHARISPPPGWIYPGLPGGPYLTTAYPFVGWPGYRGANGPLWWQALHLTGPAVPVFGPLPAFVETSEVVNHGQSRRYIGLGIGYTGWIGTYRASPRPKPPTVSAWPMLGAGPGSVGPTTSGGRHGGCLVVELKVPESAAEVYVDGTRTTQTGIDRVFESPPLEPGKDYTYELTARWVDRGVQVERKKLVTGKPGEVVRLDLSAPEVVQTGR